MPDIVAVAPDDVTLMVPPPALSVTARSVAEFEPPVTLRTALSNEMELPAPSALATPLFLTEVTLMDPPSITKGPVNVLVPLSDILPVPVFVRPPLEIAPATLKSKLDPGPSATSNTRLAPPRSSDVPIIAAMGAGPGVMDADVAVMLPLRVRTPELNVVMEPPVIVRLAMVSE